MIPHGDFRDCLQQVLRSVGKNTVLPILNHVRIQSGPEGIRLSGTDLAVLTEAYAGGSYEQLDCCVPADRLNAAIGVLSGSLVMKAGKTLTIKGGRGQVRIPFLDSEAFPKIAVSAGDKIAIPMASILPAIAKVRFACADARDIRYYMVGVNLLSDGDSVCVNATNGFTMATVKVDLKCAPFNITIPTAVLPKIKDAASMEIIGAIAVFHGAGFTTTAKLVDGKFPDVKRVLETINQERRFSVNVKQLIGVANASNNLYESKLARWVRIKTYPDKVVAGVDDQGQGGSFEVDGSGDEVEFNIAIDGLVGALSGITEEVTQIATSADLHGPVYFNEGNYQAVQMKMRV